MPAEFDCDDCGQHIVALALDVPPNPALCAECVHLPGWFEDPVLRKMLAPYLPPLTKEEPTDGQQGV